MAVLGPLLPLPGSLCGPGQAREQMATPPRGVMGLHKAYAGGDHMNFLGRMFRLTRAISHPHSMSEMRLE